MARPWLILITCMTLGGCAAASAEFATPPSSKLPASATEHGVDIPTKAEPEPRPPSV